MKKLKEFILKNNIEFLKLFHINISGEMDYKSYCANSFTEIESLSIQPDANTAFIDPFALSISGSILCEDKIRTVTKEAERIFFNKWTNAKSTFSAIFEFKIKQELRDSYNQYVDSTYNIRCEIAKELNNIGVRVVSHYSDLDKCILEIHSNTALSLADSIQKAKYVVCNVLASYGYNVLFNNQENSVVLTINHIFQNLGQSELLNKVNYFINLLLSFAHIKINNLKKVYGSIKYKKILGAEKEVISFKSNYGNHYLVLAGLLLIEASNIDIDSRFANSCTIDSKQDSKQYTELNTHEVFNTQSINNSTKESKEAHIVEYNFSIPSYLWKEKIISKLHKYKLEFPLLNEVIDDTIMYLKKEYGLQQ